MTRALAVWTLALCSCMLANAQSSSSTASPTAPPPTASPPTVEALDTSASSGFEVYPIDDWGTVANTLPTTSAVKVTDLGMCMCDLTLHSCDANCCCDTECTVRPPPSRVDSLLALPRVPSQLDQSTTKPATGVEAEQEEAKEVFSRCLPEGPPAPSLSYCDPPETTMTVSLPASGSMAVVRTKKADKFFLNRALCIADDNNPELGKFFADPSDGNEADLDVALQRDDVFFYSDEQPYETTAAASDVSTYRVGDALPYRLNVQTGNTTRAVPGATTGLALPAAAFSGVCTVGALPLAFGRNVPAAAEFPHLACEAPTANLAEECEGGLSAANLMELAVGASRGGTVDFVPVTIASLQTMADYGVLTAVNLSLPYSIRSSYDAATGMCTGALHTLELTMLHDGLGTLTAVHAALVLTNVASSDKLRQQYSVRFVTSDEATTARPTSGAPGYLTNFPVAAGLLATDPDPLSSKVAIYQLVDGLPLPSAHVDGRCSPTAVSPVRFGMSSVAQCAVPMTQGALASFCRGTATLSLPAYLAQLQQGAISPASPESYKLAPSSVVMPLSLQLLNGLLFASRDGVAEGSYAGNRTFVAAWADADAMNVAEWESTEVALLGSPRDMSWDAATATCSNVVTGVGYEFLTALVGSMNNPQSKIMVARAKYLYGDWRFKDQRSTLFDLFTTQDFTLSHTVQFTPVAQEGPQGVAPDAPPLFPKLPADVFYPFVMNSAPAPQLARPVLVLASMLATLLLAW